MAVLTRCGRAVAVGQAGGLVALIDASTQQYLDLVRLGSEAVVGLQLSRRSDALLVRCADSALHTCGLGALPEEEGGVALPRFSHAQACSAAAAAQGAKQVRSAAAPSPCQPGMAGVHARVRPWPLGLL